MLFYAKLFCIVDFRIYTIRSSVDKLIAIGMSVDISGELKIATIIPTILSGTQIITHLVFIISIISVQFPLVECCNGCSYFRQITNLMAFVYLLHSSLNHQIIKSVVYGFCFECNVTMNLHRNCKVSCFHGTTGGIDTAHSPTGRHCI